jgi:alpha-D-ribose 1-methylphosphonate 5-triphosphate synthase subunit PhnI
MKKNDYGSYTTDKVNALVNVDPAQSSPEAIKLALEQFNKEQAAEDARLALIRVKAAQSRVDRAISLLREYRKAADAQLAVVRKEGAAKEKFIATGDWNAYLTATGGH